MGKLQDARNKVEETRKSLDSVIIDEQSNDGRLKISLNANNRIVDIKIAPTLLEDEEELSDLLVITLNKALEKAKEINEREMQGAAAGMMNMPGMDQLFK